MASIRDHSADRPPARAGFFSLAHAFSGDSMAQALTFSCATLILVDHGSAGVGVVDPFGFGAGEVRLSLSDRLDLESGHGAIRGASVHLRDGGDRGALASAGGSVRGGCGDLPGGACAAQAFRRHDVSDRVAGGGTERDHRPDRDPGAGADVIGRWFRRSRTCSETTLRSSFRERFTAPAFWPPEWCWR